MNMLARSCLFLHIFFQIDEEEEYCKHYVGEDIEAEKVANLEPSLNHTSPEQGPS